MVNVQSILIVLSVLSVVDHGITGGLEYISSRQVLLTFSSDNDAPVKAVDLWASRDGGKTWQAKSTDRIGQNTLRYTTSEDGWHGFFLILRNSAGTSAQPPQSGHEPHLRVMIDTVAPTLQIHDITSPMPATPGELLTIRLSLIDKHLGEAGIRIFYRTQSGHEWTDGGVVTVTDAEIAWRMPENVSGPFDLRLVATDLAGNRSIAELTDISVKITSDSTTEPTASNEDIQQNKPPLDPVIEPPTPKQPTVAEQKNLEHLRRLAARFQAEGRYSLAAARLEDALQISPDDADLLVDLGSALYWSRRYDEAETNFGSALKTFPDHLGALEGLALVAATEKRYSHAHAYLRHLLRLKPESAKNWLSYGDIEHKLGNKTQALEAWQRVLGLDETDKKLRNHAEKRLKYFGPAKGQP